MMADDRNLLVCDAFKPVIDAALQFDGLFSLPEYAEVPPRLTQGEAELLADYVESCVPTSEVPSLAALASLLAPVSHLNEVLRVLRGRCGGGIR